MSCGGGMSQAEVKIESKSVEIRVAEGNSTQWKALREKRKKSNIAQPGNQSTTLSLAAPHLYNIKCVYSKYIHRKLARMPTYWCICV